MRFSVIIPTYNRHAELKQCSGSLLQQGLGADDYERLLQEELAIATDSCFVGDRVSADKTQEDLKTASLSDLFFQARVGQAIQILQQHTLDDDHKVVGLAADWQQVAFTRLSFCSTGSRSFLQSTARPMISSACLLCVFTCF